VYNFADVNDYKKFPKHEIKSDSVKFRFATTEMPKAPKTITVNNKKYDFEGFLKKTKTLAFLIIKNDTIQYEKYFRGYDTSSIVPSFSVAKSVTSILIGCAIDDGLIQSENDLVKNYLPYLRSDYDSVTLKHLLQMTSGMKFNESYWNPFGHAASFYYGRNLYKETKKLKTKRKAGKEFDYVSGNTQLLGMVLEKVLNGKTVAQYAEEKIWKPLQMEYDASWSLDRKKGVEKTFCCLNARARDFAKIGRLYLNEGKWNGKQVISQGWVEKSTKVDITEGSAWYYQYGWWKPGRDDYMAHGILGQYIYVHPIKNIIIVRLGKKDNGSSWRSIFPALANSY
jgi:CubicO group peptidase (beta-lactamase class C family)